MGMTVLAGNYMRQTAAKPPTLPFSVGAWIKPTGGAGAVRNVWSITDGGTNANQFAVQLGSTNVLTLSLKAAGTNLALSTAGLPALNTWCFVLAQINSTTDRSIAMLNEKGVFEAVSSVTSSAVVLTGLVSEGLGIITTTASTLPFVGIIAEFWRAEAAIPGVLKQDYVRDLAYSGPFEMPAIRGSLFNYMSLRRPPLADQLGEVAYGRGGRPPWLLVGNPLTGEHPSLSAEYVRPIAVRGFVPF